MIVNRWVKPFNEGRGLYQVHVDVTEMARRHRYVLGQCLKVAVYLGLLVVQARSRPGGDIRRQSFPYVYFLFLGGFFIFFS